MPAARASQNRRPPPFKPPRPRVSSSRTDNDDEATEDPPAKEPTKSTAPIMEISSDEFDNEDDEDEMDASFGTSPPRRRPTRTGTGTKTPPRRSILAGIDPSLEESTNKDNEDEDDEPEQEPLAIPGELTATIPSALVARLVHESFTDPKTKMTKDALSLVERYIELFTREAIARAAAERAQRDGVDLEEDGAGDGFLEVDDLERLAPQLLLDF